MATLNNYILSNLENYNKELSETSLDVFIKYINLINEYIIQCCENLYVKNINYNRYIIKKGIETLSHIFNILLLYTMNLELTYHHCQKCLFYYIEFIGQTSGENNFLQLTLKDSALFVYKKTIFEINNDHKNSFVISEKDNLKVEMINYLIKIYNGLLYLLIDKHNFSIDNKSSILKEISNNIQKITNRIVNLFFTTKDKENKDLSIIEQLKVIDYFIECIKNKEIEINFFIFIDNFIKKLSKSNLSFDKINKLTTSLNGEIMEELLNNNSITKAINLLFN
jgi:hypothetical protein